MDFIKQIQRKHNEYMYQAQPHGLGSIREENYNSPHGSFESCNFPHGLGSIREENYNSQNYHEENFHG